MWALILEGNINLSITMTTISTFAAFGMMPLWIFTLGRGLFDQGNLMVPYKEISTYAVALVVPLFIGFLIQRYLKKVGQFLARILKGFSSLLLIFIIVFAIVTNLYLFELFSWQVRVRLQSRNKNNTFTKNFIPDYHCRIGTSLVRLHARICIGQGPEAIHERQSHNCYRNGHSKHGNSDISITIFPTSTRSRLDDSRSSMRGNHDADSSSMFIHLSENKKQVRISFPEN